MTDIHRGFRDADQAAESEALFAFLDSADRLESIAICRRQMLALCPPRPGDRILDIGCGIGHTTFALAGKVGDAGAIVGIDKSRSLVAEAQRRAVALSASVTYRVGDASRLDFPDHHFDMCRTERVLMYVETPERALDEMVRVLRPGGRFALFEFDYDCIVVDAGNIALTRHILRLVADSIPSPWIGRRLPRLLRQRGGQNMTVVPHMIATPLAMFRKVIGGTVGAAVENGALEAGRLDEWWRDLARADIDGRFFAGFFGFIVCGRLASEDAGREGGKEEPGAGDAARGTGMTLARASAASCREPPRRWGKDDHAAPSHASIRPVAAGETIRG